MFIGIVALAYILAVWLCKCAILSSNMFIGTVALAYILAIWLCKCDILSSKMLRLPGGGCKVQVPELRQELFQWFIDIR